MISSTYDKLKIYTKSLSRNKIIIHRDPIHDLFTINVGKELAILFEKLLGDRNISFKAKQEMADLFKSAIYEHSEFGKILSLSNLGILFEPELKIDFNYVLDKYSTENRLFIQWEGEIENNHLYFLSKEGIKINIENLSHIII